MVAGAGIWMQDPPGCQRPVSLHLTSPSLESLETPGGAGLACVLPAARGGTPLTPQRQQEGSDSKAPRWPGPPPPLAHGHRYSLSTYRVPGAAPGHSQ